MDFSKIGRGVCRSEGVKILICSSMDELEAAAMANPFWCGWFTLNGKPTLTNRAGIALYGANCFR